MRPALARAYAGCVAPTIDHCDGGKHSRLYRFVSGSSAAEHPRSELYCAAMMGPTEAHAVFVGEEVGAGLAIGQHRPRKGVVRRIQVGGGDAAGAAFHLGQYDALSGCLAVLLTALATTPGAVVQLQPWLADLGRTTR